MRIYLGFDSREKVAYDVCKFSLEHYAGELDIVPLAHKELRRQGWFSRPWLTNAYDGNWTDLVDGRPFSTEFSHTRFLVPALMGYEGWALFMDCDMVAQGDIRHLFKLADPKYAVMCVKHNHKPSEGTKMDGVPQTSYNRKNWSSFVLWNCSHPANKHLTPEYVSTAAGGKLHAFDWLQDHQIGDLPNTYNWIEGISASNIKPEIVHYTLGGPWFSAYQEVAHADKWWKHYKNWIESDQYEPIQETVAVNYND